MSFTYPCPRKLREIMKMSLIQQESQLNIRKIWMEYHMNRPNNISCILDKYKYRHIVLKANQSPMFLLPIHRQNGHFKLVTQWQDNCFLATYSETFRKSGILATPLIVFTMFSELLFNKGIVLVRGDIIYQSLSKSEANSCWKMLESAYVEPEKYELVDTFNNNPALFDEDKYNKSYKLIV